MFLQLWMYLPGISRRFTARVLSDFFKWTMSLITFPLSQLQLSATDRRGWECVVIQRRQKYSSRRVLLTSPAPFWKTQRFSTRRLKQQMGAASCCCSKHSLLVVDSEKEEMWTWAVICDKTTNYSCSSGSHVTFRYLTEDIKSALSSFLQVLWTCRFFLHNICKLNIFMSLWNVCKCYGQRQEIPPKSCCELSFPRM